MGPAAARELASGSRAGAGTGRGGSLSGRLARAGSTVAAGAGVSLATQALTYALGFAGSVIVSRALGAEGRGTYYLPVAAAATAVTLVHLSVETANTYLYSERRIPLERLARTSSALPLLLGPAGILMMLAFLALARDSALQGVETLDYLIVVATLPFSLHLLWMANLLLLAKRLAHSQLATLAGAVAQVGGLVALAASGDLTVRAVLVLYAVSVVVPWAAHVALSWNVARPVPAFDRPLLGELVGTGLPLHVGLALSFLLLRADTFIVAAWLGTAEVGVYSLAVMLAELLWLLTNPLVTAALPFQALATREEAGRLSFKAARFNLVLAAAMGAVVAAAGWLAIPLVFGDDFRGAYASVLVLLPGIVAMAAARPLQTWLIRHGRPLRLSAMYATAFAGNIVLNLLLIGPLGIEGAALASTVAYCGLAAAMIAWGLRLAGTGAVEALRPRAEDVAALRRVLRRG